MNADNEINFRSLAYTDIETLLICFNDSFKDYFVPLQLTKEQLAGKIYAEAIDMKLSFGAFHNGQLVAFILNGIDDIYNKKTAYNAGTGVLPGYRGQKLSMFLYIYLIDELKKNGIEKAILEVIDQNIAAIKTYERIGFAITASLISSKGKPENKTFDPSTIQISKHPDWGMITTMCEWKPAWQYNNNTLRRAWNNYTLFTSGDDIVMAYCIANPENGRIAHFGRNENGDEHISNLFGYLASTIEPPLTIIHVDEIATEANAFIKKTGIQHFINSFEMQMDI